MAHSNVSSTMDLFAAHPAVVLLVDPLSRRIVDANPAAAAFYGWSRGELTSLRLSDIDAGPANGGDASGDAGTQPGGARDGHDRVQARHRLADGRLAWVEVSSGAVPAPDGEWLLTIVHQRADTVDAAEAMRREAERVSMALTAVIATIRELSRAHGKSPYQAVCEALATSAGFPFAWVAGVPETPHGAVVRLAAAGAAPDFLDRITVLADASPEGDGPTGRALRTGATQLLRHVDPDAFLPDWRSALRQARIASAISIPLRDPRGRVVAALSVYSRADDAFGPREVEVLTALAGDLRDAVETRHLEEQVRAAHAEHARDERRLHDAMVGTVRVLARAIEQRDPYTAGHQARVARIAGAIGRRMGLDDARLEGLELAAELHDIGKIATPLDLLAKPGRLSDAEFAIVRQHAQNGYDIVAGIDFPWPIARVVQQHHERLDGSGYPLGLAGEAISLEARIVGVADVYEAMTSHRPYRPALPREHAMREFRDHPERYDPDVLAALAQVLDDEAL